MDMKKSGQEGALHAVPHPGEMMNCERAEYKKEALRQLKKCKIAVRGPCDTPRFPKKKSTCNSQAAEQFWSKLNKLRLLCTMRRAHYTFLLRQSCARRNRFSRSDKCRKDYTPAVSKKRARTGT
eukprot:5256627-Pyramimonas_sp.AAC.1